MSILVKFEVYPGVEFTRLVRPNGTIPLFAVRELDEKILRKRPIVAANNDDGDISVTGKKRGRDHKVPSCKPSSGANILFGSSEQAIRLRVRSTINNLGMDVVSATRPEIRLLKDAQILGKRAPSCALMGAEDAIKLLQFFGHTVCSDALKKLCAAHKWFGRPGTVGTDTGSKVYHDIDENIMDTNRRHRGNSSANRLSQRPNKRVRKSRSAARASANMLEQDHQAVTFLAIAARAAAIEHNSEAILLKKEGGGASTMRKRNKLNRVY